MLRHITILPAFAAVAALSAAAAAAPKKPAKPAAPVPVEKDPLRADHVAKFIDKYDHDAEREAFFQTAGDDGELSRDEFYKSRDASRKKDQGKDIGDAVLLVRSYEHWGNAASPHDADGSGQLNWPEFAKHREVMKKLLLQRYDKDRNGKLLGPEREQANDWLRRDIHVPGRRRYPWRIAHWDGDGDGKLAPHEQRARQVWLVRQAEEKRKQDELYQWDVNKDGRLDTQELAAKEAEMKRREEARKILLREWDRNRDGKLDEKEKYLIEKCNVDDPRRKRHLLSRFDRNRNGKIEGREGKAMIQHYLRQYEAEKRQAELRRWDKNRDGRLDARERAVRDVELRKEKQRQKQASPGR